MGFIKEFKEFAMKGNMIDMAVGIIIGGAFGKVISSLVNDIIMPPLGILIGGVDFKDLAITLKSAVGETPAVAIKYGAFANNIIDFLIIAFAIFMAIKAMSYLRKKEEAAKPALLPSRQEVLLEEIRDLMKKKK